MHFDIMRVYDVKADCLIITAADEADLIIAFWES